MSQQHLVVPAEVPCCLVDDETDETSSIDSEIGSLSSEATLDNGIVRIDTPENLRELLKELLFDQVHGERRAHCTAPVNQIGRRFEDGKKQIQSQGLCTQLTELEAIAVITVLETTVDMLHILGLLKDKPQVQPDTCFKTLEERYWYNSSSAESSKVTSFKINESVGHRFGNEREPLPLSKDPLGDDSELADMVHFQKERCAVENVLSQTIDHLVHNGNYKPLADFVLQNLFVKTEEEALLASLKQTEREVQHVKQELETLGEDLEEARRELEEECTNLWAEAHDIVETSEAQKVYMEKWLAATVEQHQYRLEMQEKELSEQLTKLKLELDREINADNQIMEYLKLDNERLQGEVESWVQKTKEDSNNIDDEIKQVKSKLDEVMQKNKELTDLFDSRQSVILLEEQEKEEKRREEEQQILRSTMARRIQRWWRAVLLRHRIRMLKNKKNKQKQEKKKAGK